MQTAQPTTLFVYTCNLVAYARLKTTKAAESGTFTSEAKVPAELLEHYL